MLRTASLAFGALAASVFWLAGPAPAQSITSYPSTASISPARVQPYMRVPAGAHGEAAALKADQDAMRVATQPKKKAGKGR